MQSNHYTYSRVSYYTISDFWHGTLVCMIASSFSVSIWYVAPMFQAAMLLEICKSTATFSKAYYTTDITTLELMMCNMCTKITALLRRIAYEVVKCFIRLLPLQCTVHTSVKYSVIAWQ